MFSFRLWNLDPVWLRARKRASNQRANRRKKLNARRNGKLRTLQPMRQKTAVGPRRRGETGNFDTTRRAALDSPPLGEALPAASAAPNLAGAVSSAQSTADARRSKWAMSRGVRLPRRRALYRSWAM